MIELWATMIYLGAHFGAEGVVWTEAVQIFASLLAFDAHLGDVGELEARILVCKVDAGWLDVPHDKFRSS